MPDLGRLDDLAALFTCHGDLAHDQVGWRLRAAGRLPTPDEVADIVRDTFLIAYENREPPPPERRRAWVLALARNECLRALETPGRRRWAVAAAPVPPRELDPAPPATDASPGLAAAELRIMVRWATEQLDRREREILELGVRHRLSADEIAQVLGIGPAVAGWALDALRAHLARTLGAALLARGRGGTCGRLADMARRWNGAPSADRMRRFLRHTDSCPTCEQERVERVDAESVLRLPGVAGAPEPVRRWVLADALDDGLSGERQALARRAGPYDAAGFPRPLDADEPVARSSRLTVQRRSAVPRAALRGR